MVLELNLSVSELPRPSFADGDALAAHWSFVEQYDRAVAGFETDELDVAEFWAALAGLGFNYSEIRKHIDNPGWRIPQGFVKSTQGVICSF